MESPVNFELKAEPVSPLWELELLDVGEVWEGDLGLSSEGDVKLIWEHEDASEFIGEGEPLFSLELDQIILEEDEELKEEPFTSWLDSGAIYNGPSSNSLPVLPTTPTAFSPPNDLWTSPGSPPDEKPNVFAPGGSAAPSDPLAASSVDLLKEFEAVLNQAAGSLTPPDSPRSNNNVNVLLQTMSSDLHPLPLSTSSNQGFIVMQDIANCTGVVEAELDQLMAETINKNDAREDTVNKNGRPWDSPSASSSGASDSGYEDPDWSPAKSSESVDEPHLTKKLRLTSTEERRMRKKEQNKNAATRYRMKKKMEMEEIIGEEKGLQDRNETLKTEVVEITREIRYLKRLMGDLFRAKGLISAK